METLINSLEKILDIWKEDREGFVELVQPGLTYQEIQNSISHLPFQIPQELYLLYQWRNGIKFPEGPIYYDGVRDFIPGCQFIPLEDAIQECERLENWRKTYTSLSDENCDRPWFPFLSDGDAGHFIVLGDENRHESSSILSVDCNAGLLPSIQYPNLTSMMAMVTECYESGSYYYETEVMDQFGTTVEFFHENPKEVNRIRRKHLSKR